MKRVFTVLNIIGALLAVALVSIGFSSNLSSGREIYSQVVNHSTGAEVNNLTNSLYTCATSTEESLDAILTSTQKKYMFELSTTLDKLIASEKHLSLYLLNDDKKSIKTNYIANNIEDLQTKRNDLIHEITIYKTKISGNIYGDPEGTFSIIIKDILTYLKDYANYIDLLNDYVHNTINANTSTVYNLIDLHIRFVDNIATNFDDLTFDKSTFESIEYYNKMFKFDDSLNIITRNGLTGGLYSIEAYNFNTNYSRCDKTDLAYKFATLKLTNNIDPVTETDNTNLAYYYLNILLKEGL